MRLMSLRCEYEKFVRGFERTFEIDNDGSLRCDDIASAMMWYNDAKNQTMMNLIVRNVPTLELITHNPRDIVNKNKVQMLRAYSIAFHAYERYCRVLGRKPKRPEDAMSSINSKAELRAAKTEAEQAHEAAIDALKTARIRTEAAEHAVKEAAGKSGGRVLAALCQALVKATEDKVSAEVDVKAAGDMVKAARAALNLYVSEKRKERKAKQLLEELAAAEEAASAAATDEEMPSPDRRGKNKKRARRHHETEEE